MPWRCAAGAAKSVRSDMVNADAIIAERALAVRYAPADRRAALAALFALDARLRAIALAAREPVIGLMRLTWWREALASLDTAPAPAEPLLRELERVVRPHVTGAALARLTDGWELLLDGDVDWAEVARERAWLFRLAEEVLGASDARVPVVGEAWARADLALSWPAAGRSEPGVLDAAYAAPWPRALRALSALGLLVRVDAEAKSAAGSPRRVARLLAHRLTGR